MKSFSAIVVSVALACCAANYASALVQSGSPDRGPPQGVCDVKYALQRDLASVLTDPTGVRTLNEARESVKDICTDPRAHNALVDLLDGFADVVADPNVSRTLGNAMYWARRVLKEKNFRVVWLEMMRGLNTVFASAAAADRASNGAYDLLEGTLLSPHFDTSFARVVSSLGRALKARNDNKLVALAYSFASRAKNAATSVGVGGGGRGAGAGRTAATAAAGRRQPSAASGSLKY